MDKVALALVLFSGLFHVVRDFFVKNTKNKQVFLWLFLVVGLVISFPYAIFFLIKEEFTITNISIVLISGVIHALYLICLPKAYEAGDLSHVYPIARSAPVLVLIFAVIFLEESVSTRGILGVVTITFGVYMINAKALNLKALLEPLRSIPRESASRLAFLAMLIVATYSLIDKVGVSFFHPISYFFLLQITTLIYLTPYVLLSEDKAKISLEWRENKWNMLKASVFDVLSYTLALAALKIAQASYVVGMRQYSVILAVIIGHKLLKEKYVKVRLTATVVIFIGLLLIAFA